MTDDDTAGVTVSVTQLTVTEAAGAGRTATYTVKLNTQPTGEVTITPSSSAESATTVSRALTFTTANWSTAQTVTVTGVDDDVDQVGTDRTATVSHTVSGGDYGDISAGSVSVTVTDDDTAEITVSALAAITEGESGTYTVKLNTQPSSDVVISLTVSGSSEVTVADTDGETAGVQNTLTFTSTDWSTPQTVTVNAAEDDDAVNDSADHRPRRWWTMRAPTSTTPWPTRTWRSASPTTTRRGSRSPPPTPSPWAREPAPPTRSKLDSEPSPPTW